MGRGAATSYRANLEAWVIKTLRHVPELKSEQVLLCYQP